MALSKKWGLLLTIAVTAVSVQRSSTGESHSVEVTKRDLPVGGVRTKDRWTYYGGLICFNKILPSPDGTALWAATNKGVIRLNVAQETLTSFTTLDGLADNLTRDLCFDSRGALWVATYSGLSRLDPSGWRSWKRRDGLEEAHLTRVAIDRQDEPWIGAGGPSGAVLSHLHNGKWVHYSREFDGLPGSAVDLLHADRRGQVWALLSDGDRSPGQAGALQPRAYALVAFLPDGSWRQVSLPKHLLSYARGRPVTALATGPNDRLLAASPLGLFAWDGEQWERYGLKEGLPAESVRALSPGPEGRVWGLAQDSLFSFDGAKASLEVRLPEEMAALCEKSERIAVGADGDVWVAPEPPILLVHGVGLQWTLYLPELDGPMSAPGRGIQSILRDTAGRYYFGGSGAAGGLTRFDGQKWEVVYTGNVLDAALDRDDKPWIVTGSVLSYSDKDWVEEFRSLGLPGPWTGIEPDRRGVLWIAGEKDLLAWDGSKIVRHAGDVPQFLPPYPAMALGPNGHFWVLSAQGVALWQGERKWSVVGKATGLPGLRGNAMAVGPRGEVYIGGPWGAAKYDGASWTQYAPAAAEHPSALPVLPGRAVNTVFVDRQGTVWFGTDEGGVATFDGRSWGKVSADDGLASNSVWSIFEDDDAFWFGTAAGVTRFRKQ